MRLFPPISASSFPGKRVDSYRAGIIPIIKSEVKGQLSKVNYAVFLIKLVNIANNEFIFGFRASISFSEINFNINAISN